MKVSVEFTVGKVKDGVATQIDVVFDVVEKGILEHPAIFSVGWLPVGSGQGIYDVLAMNPLLSFAGHKSLRVCCPTFAEAQRFAVNTNHAIKDGYRMYKRLISEKALMDDISLKNFVIDTELQSTPIHGPASEPSLSDPEKRIKANSRIFRELGDEIRYSVQEIIENIKDSDRLRSTWLCMEDDKRQELTQGWYRIVEKYLEPFVASVICQISDMTVVHIPIVDAEDVKSESPFTGTWTEAHFYEAMQQSVREIASNIAGSDKNWSHTLLVQAWGHLSNEQRDKAKQIWNEILVKNLEHQIACAIAE